MKYSTIDFLKTATHTAEHFGFRTVEKLRKDPACRECQSPLDHTIDTNDRMSDLHGGISMDGVITFCDEKLHALKSPVLLYTLAS